MRSNQYSGLTLAAISMHLLAAAVNAIPLPQPLAGRNSLFPTGVAGSFAETFKKTNLGNSEYTCSRNGLPCRDLNNDEDEDDFDSFEPGSDSDDDEDEDDGITRFSSGSLQREEFTDENGVDKIVISGNIYNSESSQYTDAAFSDEVEYDSDEEMDEDEEEASSIEEFQSVDSTQTCTRNGFPCGQFPEGSQRELNIERTSSCTRNGIPCEEFVEGQDEEERFTINKSNDSYKTCTRNGMPCDEYERLAAAGELPETENEYQVSTGRRAPQ